jgi:hypothetical protein
MSILLRRLTTLPMVNRMNHCFVCDAGQNSYSAHYLCLDQVSRTINLDSCADNICIVLSW